eukprot:4128911-Amphidinium_carterae.1
MSVDSGCSRWFLLGTHRSHHHHPPHHHHHHHHQQPKWGQISTQATKFLPSATFGLLKPTSTSQLFALVPPTQHVRLRHCAAHWQCDADAADVVDIDDTTMRVVFFLTSSCFDGLSVSKTSK